MDGESDATRSAGRVWKHRKQRTAEAGNDRPCRWSVPEMGGRDSLFSLIHRLVTDTDCSITCAHVDGAKLAVTLSEGSDFCIFGC